MCLQPQTHSAMDVLDRHIDPNAEEVTGEFPCEPSIVTTRTHPEHQ